MKYSRLSRTGSLLQAALILTVSSSAALAQAPKDKTKPVVAKPAKPTAAGKPSAKPSPADAKLNQQLAANMKLFGVLSRYAQTLSTAKDAASAHQAVTKLESITKDAITAGEELVKLGKPDAEMEMKLATDADLKMTSETVAEQTRAAIKALATNAEVKTILAPAVENFQAALNRVQQAADEPKPLTTASSANKASSATASSPPTDKTSPAGTTQVPPPPPR